MDLRTEIFSADRVPRNHFQLISFKKFIKCDFFIFHKKKDFNNNIVKPKVYFFLVKIERNSSK